MLVVGEKEAEENTLSVRKRGEGDIGAMSIDETVALILEDIKRKGRKDSMESV